MNHDSGVLRGNPTGAALYVVAVVIQYERPEERLSEVWQCNIVAMNINEAVRAAVVWAKFQWPEHFRREYEAQTTRTAVQAFAVMAPIAVDGIAESVRP